MFATLIQLLQNKYVAAAAIAAVGLLLQFWPQLWALAFAAGRWLATSMPSLPTFSPIVPAVPAGPATDENYLDMQAFYRLEARFQRANCKPGQDAMKQVAANFLLHQD